MWKSASRTLKSTFKKGVLKCNTVLSTNAQQNKHPLILLKFTPFLQNHCNRFYNSYNGTTENFTKENKEGPNEKKTSFLECLDNPLIDALKWSGIFALGYFTILQYKLRQAFPHEAYRGCALPERSCYHKALKFLVDVTGIKPYSCVIPEVQAAKSKKKGQQLTESPNNNLEFEEKDFNSLETAHKKVLGAVSNLLGTQCMQSGEYNEAFEYFIQSAEEEHVAGIFNLGICHEKGLGTSQNLQKAAELYQRAADLGHATAMYNLGVFYAQGRGKIKVDINQARKLFESAASLGQADAIKALSLEKKSAGDVPESKFLSNKISGKGENTLNDLIFNTILGQSSNCFKQFTSCDSEAKSHCHSFEIPFQGNKLSSSLDGDSGVLDLSPQNESCAVLA